MNFSHPHIGGAGWQYLKSHTQQRSGFFEYDAVATASFQVGFLPTVAFDIDYIGGPFFGFKPFMLSWR